MSDDMHKKLSLHAAFTWYLSSYHAHKPRYAITFHFHVLCFILFIHNVSKKKLRSSFVISMYHGTMAGIKDSKYVYAKERKNYMKNVHIMYLKNSNKKRKIWKSRWQNEIFEEKKNRKCVQHVLKL